jgi:hypothetical protein
MSLLAPSLSTRDDLVALPEAAAALGVDPVALRLLVDAHALSVTHPRALLGGGLGLLHRSELVDPPQDVGAALSNARAFTTYLAERPPVHRRPTARGLQAPLWTARSGRVGLAVRPADIRPWTITHATTKHHCTVDGLTALLTAAGFEARRLVSLSAPDKSDISTKQVSWHCLMAPHWVAEHVAQLHDAARDDGPAGEA